MVGIGNEGTQAWAGHQPPDRLPLYSIDPNHWTMHNQLTLSLISLATCGLCTLGATAQTSFDHDRISSPGLLPPGILSEGYPGPPLVAIPAAFLGLGPLDEIDALSYGDDRVIDTLHTIVFSPDVFSAGAPGSGVAFEVSVDTAPGGPPAAAADIFIQDPAAAIGNLLAPPTLGYAAGTLTGDEANAAWAPPCGADGTCRDLDAFDYSDPLAALGVYFSLAPGSPALVAIGATPGDILYSDLSGTPPIIAILAGAGPATDVNLGIPGLNLDALNCIGSTGDVATGGGVILAGPVGPSVGGGPPPPSTHYAQYSVSFTGVMDADVLVRIAAGAFGIHTPAPALGLMPPENLNALEVTQPVGCPPSPATVFPYNGIGINRDTLFATTVVIGIPWSALLFPQFGRGPGAWVILMRSTPAAGPVLDLGLFFLLPPAGPSELLVGAGFIANFFPAAHGGSGTSASFSVPVPPTCALVGAPWHAQAIVLGDLPAGAGILDPWFSTATGGVIGTF